MSLLKGQVPELLELPGAHAPVLFPLGTKISALHRKWDSIHCHKSGVLIVHTQKTVNLVREKILSLSTHALKAWPSCLRITCPMRWYQDKYTVSSMASSIVSD